MYHPPCNKCLPSVTFTAHNHTTLYATLITSAYIIKQHNRRLISYSSDVRSGDAKLASHRRHQYTVELTASGKQSHTHTYTDRNNQIKHSIYWLPHPAYLPGLLWPSNIHQSACQSSSIQDCQTARVPGDMSAFQET